MQSKNSSGDDGGGGLVKKLLFPSFTDAGSNDTFLAPVNNEHQQQDDEDTIQSPATNATPPEKHKVEYDVSQARGYVPSKTISSALFSDMGGSLTSPLVPQKLLTDDSSSTTLNATADLSMDMSMIVNTGASAVKQIDNDLNVSSESFNIAENSIMEEDGFGLVQGEGDEEEDNFIDSIKSLTSPIGGMLHDTEDRDTTTPIGTSILSPPKMSRHTQIHNDSNQLIQDDGSINHHASSSVPDGEMALKEYGANDSQLTSDNSALSHIHNTSMSNLFRTQSYGEHSEAPSSLLGCNFLSNGNKLLDGVTKHNDMQMNKGYDEDRHDGSVSDECMAENDGKDDGEESKRNDQTKNDTTKIASKFERADTQYPVHHDGGDDSSCDANSLVSEYGSDIGDLKIRLDDVYAMAAVEEEAGEEEAHFVNTNLDNPHTKTKLSPLQDVQNDPWMSFGDDEQGDKENHVNRNPRVASPNLIWGNNGIEMETAKAIEKDQSNDKFESFSTKTGMNSPVSPVRRDGTNSSTSPTTPIATVSAAFRRFGNGMSNITRGSKSPSFTDPILNVDGVQDLDLKNSRKSERIQLSPRLGPFSFRSTKSTEESDIGSPGSVMRSVRDQISSPLHHVRSGCLSFVPESGLPPYANMLRMHDSPPSSPMLIPKSSQFSSHSTGHSPQLRFKSQSWEAGSNSIRENNHYDRITDIDVEMDRRKATQHKPGSNLFSGLSAASTGVAFRNNGGNVLIREGQPFQAAISPGRRSQFINSLGHLTEKERAETVPTRKNSYPPVLLRSPQRVGDIEKEDALDILSLLVERSVAFHEKTDQSSGIADVEESVDNDYAAQSDSSQPSQCQNDVPPTSSETTQNENIIVKSQTQPCLPSSVSNIQDSIEELRVISKNQQDDSTISINHETRMGALNELERSYTYALEMKRAALSASTWLHAIGRSNKNDEHNSPTDSSIDKSVSTDFSNGITTEQILKHQHSAALSISESVIDDRMKMNPDSLKSALQSDQLQFVAKDELNKRLDRELSVCRAEIGRLKSVTRSEAIFVSPNKSILDEEGEDESSASSKEEEFLETGARTEIISSFLEFSDVKDIDISRDLSASEALSSTVESKRELLLLKAELSQANKKIKLMENDLEKLYQSHTSGEDASSIEPVGVLNDSETKEIDSCDKGSEILAKHAVTRLVQGDQRDLPSQSCVGVIPFSDDLLKKDLDNYVEVIRKADKAEIELLNERLEEANQSNRNVGKLDEKMINVRMLDGENFVTEWNKLGPLPPPPDHDLDSPIVTSLLSQWTDDCSTRNALLSWMEKLIEGVDPISVPPLKLSSLDHQVRDGFTMHVLPLLLRRSDLHLEVTSRAQRRTSYDIIATVKSPQSVHGGSIPLNSHNGKSNLTKPSLRNHVSNSHMMAFKASGGIITNDDLAGECAPMHDKFKFSPQGTGHLHGTESGSVTHSSVTEYISNQIEKSTHLERRVQTENLQPSETSVDSNLAGGNSTVGSSHPDSITQKNPQQPSIMAGAINAVGGLLSRRKLHQSPRSSLQVTSEEDKQHESPNQSHPSGSVLLPTLGKNPRKKFKNPFPNLSSTALVRGRANLPKPSTLVENEDEDQPYHRVVSAPPGRIGMTFVQYRGHAIISDVYQNSPLQGWVFPSDILIAIDEVPVSGRRVPEIVKLLNARKDRQRALRVISSHAMSDLMTTQNSAALMDG